MNRTDCSFFHLYGLYFGKKKVWKMMMPTCKLQNKRCHYSFSANYAYGIISHNYWLALVMKYSVSKWPFCSSMSMLACLFHWASGSIAS